MMLLVLTFGMAGMGCLHLQELLGIGPRKPTVVIKEIIIKKFVMPSLELEIHALVQNPNGFDLKLNRMVYRATAMETLLAHGEYLEPFKVPAEDSALLNIPLFVNFENAKSLMERFIKSPQRIAVKIDAAVTFDTPFGEINHVFQDEKPIGIN